MAGPSPPCPRAGPSLVDAGLYTRHVPLFFLLSGYLWSAHEAGDRRSTRAETGRRFRTVMVPYLAWLVVTLIVHTAILVERDEFTADAVVLLLLGGSLNAGPFGAYWFMPALSLSSVVFRALERVRPPASQRPST